MHSATVMANSPDPSGPGQSGAAAGINRFDGRVPGENPYPDRSVPQGSRSPFPDDSDPLQPANLDDRLRDEIAAALGRDGTGVSIAASMGYVTVAGYVADDAAKRRIVAITWRVAGVVSVEDRLEVR